MTFLIIFCVLAAVIFLGACAHVWIQRHIDVGDVETTL